MSDVFVSEQYRHVTVLMRPLESVPVDQRTEKQIKELDYLRSREIDLRKAAQQQQQQQQQTTVATPVTSDGGAIMTTETSTSESPTNKRRKISSNEKKEDGNESESDSVSGMQALTRAADAVSPTASEDIGEEMKQKIEFETIRQNARRQAHSEIERKRRTRINQQIEEIAGLIPLSIKRETHRNKVGTLESARNYMNQLTSENERLEQSIKYLRESISHLRSVGTTGGKRKVKD